MKQNKALYLDPRLDADIRVKDLLGRMTLDEKIMQLGSAGPGDLLQKEKLSGRKLRKVLGGK